MPGYYLTWQMLIGNHTKSQELLERVLVIYEKNYGKHHLQIAWVLNSLGDTYLLKGDLEIAQSLINKALNIFQQNNHPESYISLESLSDLYSKKSLEAVNKNNINRANFFKQISADYLKRALNIVTDYFPEHSPHILRVETKFKNLN